MAASRSDELRMEPAVGESAHVTFVSKDTVQIYIFQKISCGETRQSQATGGGGRWSSVLDHRGRCCIDQQETGLKPSSLVHRHRRHSRNRRDRRKTGNI